MRAFATILLTLACGTAFAVSMAGGKIPLPAGAVQERQGQDADGIWYENYSTDRGGTRNFYEQTLSREGWSLVTPLGPEDATDCGGDWGGTYEKDGLKFKLHVCGFDQEGANTYIFFHFFWDNPSGKQGTAEKADEIHR